MTRQLVESGELMPMALLDYFIIMGEGYTSMAERNLLKLLFYTFRGRPVVAEYMDELHGSIQRRPEHPSPLLRRASTHQEV